MRSGRVGNATEILWTKRGAIRVSQFIHSPRGVAVQDWLEDLAIEKMAVSSGSPYNDHEVRVVTVDQEPWFVGNDLCEVLGINNSRQALARLESHDVQNR